MPGLAALRSYRFGSDFNSDLFAGLSVAAVALPVSIAYAELAGLSPAVGLYASIGPLLAYALFGTSPQLMVNPDAASCAILAAAVTPLAGGDPSLYLSLATALTLFTGILCMLASVFRLGVLANFLSRPILVGFLNGIALSIFLGQIGKVLGFQVTASKIVPKLLEIISKLPSTQMPTLLVTLFSIAVLLLVRKFITKVPAALAVLVLSAVVVKLFDLQSLGVAVLAPVPAGLPALALPIVPLDTVPQLLGSGAGLALVLFTSGTITSRSFASRGGYEVDVDRELVAYGAANIASSLAQGFVVTGADSRTAMAVTAGAKTQVTGLVAAAVIALVLLFFHRSASVRSSRGPWCCPDFSRTVAVGFLQPPTVVADGSARVWPVPGNDRRGCGTGIHQRHSDCRGAGHCAVCETHGSAKCGIAWQRKRSSRPAFHRPPYISQGDPWPGSVSFQRTAGLLQRRTFQTMRSESGQGIGRGSPLVCD